MFDTAINSHRLAALLYDVSITALKFRGAATGHTGSLIVSAYCSAGGDVGSASLCQLTGFSDVIHCQYLEQTS